MSEDNNAADHEVGRHGFDGWAVPVVIFIFCALVTYLSTTFDKAPEIVIGDAMQPRSFPMFLMAIMAVLNCFLIVQMMNTAPSKRRPIVWQTYAVAVCFAIFYGLTVTLDIFIAMAAVMFIIGVALGQKPVIAAVVALATPTAIFFIFDLVLKVRFPRGVLTNLYYG